MRISICGGGPAGLFFALLIKRQFPSYSVQVVEQNSADATYGFGVAFFDWDFIEPLAPKLHAELVAYRDKCAPADNMTLIYRGVEVPLQGTPSLNIGRLDMLKMLQRHAADAGVEFTFGARVETLTDLPAADLYVVADGVNSAIRGPLEAIFGTKKEPRPNLWAWYGTTKIFRSTSLIFKETTDGIYIGHAYQYSPTRSGFVVEALPNTWESAGFSRMSEEESRAYCSKIFSEELSGHELISNRSLWFHVPMITNERWSHENLVLLGDALRTGHPTIGSGTRLAMIDAEHLVRALRRHPTDLPLALATYEETRKPSSDAMVRAALRSTAWYETAADRIHLDPVSLAYSYMMRTGKIGHERLREFDRSLIEQYEKLIGIPEDRASLVVVYHSGSGQTKRMADHIAEGARSVPGLSVATIPVDETKARWTEINDSDAMIFGSPTYMGTVSADFKRFMEDLSTWWSRQRWRGKLAAGFTVSSNPSGDKLNTLTQMAIFAAQHGMLWMPLDLLGGNATAKGSELELNQFGGWMGAMGQAKVGVNPEQALSASDRRTAEHLGRTVGEYARAFARRKRPL